MYFYVSVVIEFLRDELSFLIKTHYSRNYYLAHHTSPFKHIINFSSRMVRQIINENNLEFRCIEKGHSEGHC